MHGERREPVRVNRVAGRTGADAGVFRVADVGLERGQAGGAARSKPRDQTT